MSTPHSLPRRLVFSVLFWLLRYVVWPLTKLAFCLLFACIALVLAGIGEEARRRYEPVAA